MQGADRNTLFFAKICLNKKSSLLPDWSGQAKPDKLSLKNLQQQRRNKAV